MSVKQLEETQKEKTEPNKNKIYQSAKHIAELKKQNEVPMSSNRDVHSDDDDDPDNNIPLS